MNSLQIGLIAIGAFVVALLFVWHWWQTRRLGRRDQSVKPDLSSSRGTREDDGAPLLTDVEEPAITAPRATLPGRAEPTLDPAVAQAWEPRVRLEPDDPPTAIEPEELPPDTGVAADTPPPASSGVTQHSGEAEPAAAPRTRLQSEWPFDERLHVHASVVNLTGGPFDAAPFVAAAGRATAWVRLFRQSPWDMFDPMHVGSVQQLVLALPLASRAGPIEASDIDAWRFALTELATAQGAEAQFHGFRDGPARAVELDSFLAAVDIIPAAYLVKKDGGQWPGTKLRGTLEANGFRLQSDGRFAYHEVESDAVIFHAVDGFERPFTPERLRTENIAALRCVLEPVRLTQPLARFDVFRQSLRALSKLLGADLKTSEGAALDEAEFAAMRDEVKAAMDALAGAGIEPGSDTARSLFG